MRHTNKIGFLLLASLLFISGEIISQEIATRLYTTKEDGLPQTQILNIRKSPDNSLLLCSHGGLMRYDGFSFTSITTNDGLSSNLVIDAAYFHDTLYILTADAVHLFVGDKICGTIPAADGHKLYCGILALSEQGKYIYNISDHQEGAYMNLVTGELFHSFQGKAVRDHLFTITDSSFLICDRNKLFEQGFNATTKHEIFRSETPIIGISFDRGPLFIMCSRNKKDTTYISEIYVCKRTKSIEIVDTVSAIPEEFHVHGQKLSAIYPAGEKTYFIVHADGWLYFVENNIFYRFPVNYNNVHGAVFDEDGNAWAGTEKGLLKIFTKGFRYLFPERGFPDNIWAAAGIGDNEFLLAGYESGLYLYSGTGEKIHEWPSHAGLYYYNTICQGFGDELIISTCPGITRFNTKTKTRQVFKEKMPQTTLTVFKDESDNRILVGHMYALVSIDDHYNVDTLLVTKDLGANSTILAIERIDDIVYLGLSRGLIAYDVKTGDSILLINEKIRINDLSVDSKGNLWGATNAGLVNIRHDGNYKPIEGIPITESVLTLEILPKDILFAASINNLYRIDLDKFHGNLPGFYKSYGSTNGYLGGEPGQNCFFLDERGDLWLPTALNVVKILPDELSVQNETICPAINHFSCFGNDMKYIQMTIEHEKVPEQIPYSKNNVSIGYSSIVLTHPDAVSYQCMLEGFQTNWTEPTEKIQQTFTNLDPGNYIFLVRAALDGDFSQAPVTRIQFTIAPPFWMTWWFRIMTIIIILMILISVLLRIRQRIRQKAEVNYQLSRLKGDALAAQLDHHFLANCTARITMLYENDQLKEAQDYTRSLTRFLQRNLLLLRSEKIPLQEELMLINEYIQLEKSHGIPFRFEIEIGETVQPEGIFLPPFLIQPIVENAIHHGVKSLPSDQGHISLKVTKTNETIWISVADNGPGITNPTEKKTVGNKVGMHIVKERLSLMDRTGNLTIKDQSPGTLVSLSFRLS